MEIVGRVHGEGGVWTDAVFMDGDRCLLPPLLSLSAGFTWIGRFIWKDRGHIARSVLNTGQR